MRCSASEALITFLSANGVDRIFCVPGESYLTALDAMYEHPTIDVVACRHEGGAGFMAVADARLTGRPGVLFTSRGPGSMNAAISLHAAQQDGVPLLAFIGHVTREELGRGAFQEVDYRQTFGDIAKGVFEVHSGNRMLDLVAQAWRLATNGTPGPVVIVLPEDMLADDIKMDASLPLPTPLKSGPTTTDLNAIQQRLSEAKRPLLLAGGQINTPEARAALRRVAELWGLPVLGTFKQQEVMANDHPNWVGQVGFVMPTLMTECLAQADLILAVGTRLGDISTQGYRFPAAPVPEQDVIHVYPDPDQIGRNIAPWMGVVADSGSFLTELGKLPAPTATDERQAWLDELSGNYRSLGKYVANTSVHGVDPGGVVTAVNRHAAADSVFCLDAGNFATWVHRYLVAHQGQRVLASASGAMGSGVPFAVSAGLRDPQGMVIAFLGDGGALMTCNELATAVHHGVNIKIIIMDNSLYGTIKGFQEKLFPGRQVGTSLTNPDFAAWAESFGVRGYTIDDDASIDNIVESALAHPGPAVIHVKQNPGRLTAFS
ncbi:thiamine pyrophosphate-dependent enzyme [Halomonas huangheensis]|uniref:Acetolactate synthase n=1 Tax=Halomonas huangheensis TaxID=1178482 RepID=W1NBN7_9GAMM|nr:thiamine pyrophosphate-dependent enzyme [Halomonas huangheensis]ALM53762.1 hypothetical protein AR456_16890 [Halomonas huangheensis]ERL52315.1 hypothetical protein BJB45_10130 [Halomonas huangheensis]